MSQPLQVVVGGLWRGELAASGEPSFIPSLIVPSLIVPSLIVPSLIVFVVVVPAVTPGVWRWRGERDKRLE